MYQRSYYPGEEQAVSVPREYDGSLNFEKNEGTEEHVECGKVCDGGERRGGLFSLPRGIPGKLFDGFELGVEELLLIGAALFLFISKSGDFECIFILIALLFVR